MDLGLEGRVALVTGASRGLGAAITRALSAEGVRVAAVARSEPELAALAAECPVEVIPLVCDLTDLAAVRAVPALAAERLGRLDILVNNAGVVSRGAFIEQDDAALAEVFTVNLFAPIALAKGAAAIFSSTGAGVIVNIASNGGLTGVPRLAAYCGSKAALIRIMEALAAEWAPLGIRVIAIAPGAFATDAQPFDLGDSAAVGRRASRIPAGRLGRPDEVAALTAFLCSDLSAFVHGSTVIIDGGEHALMGPYPLPHPAKGSNR